jgi:hypothetical protein
MLGPLKEMVVFLSWKINAENNIFTSSAICYHKVFFFHSKYKIFSKIKYRLAKAIYMAYNLTRIRIILYNIKSIKENKGAFNKYIIGDSCASELLSFRFVAGVWCLAAFIFVQAYTSTLITYVVMPINPPLINSINDVFENRDIQLLIYKIAPLNIFSSVRLI